jgi:invasion protein IalB
MNRLLSGASLFVLGVANFCNAAVEPDKQTYTSGQWTVSCGTSRMSEATTCSAGLDMQHATYPIGAFSVIINPAIPWVNIVGSPMILIGQARVDKNSPVVCSGEICIVSTASSTGIISQMRHGKTLLVDLTTVSGNFQFDLDLSGYQDVVAHAEQWGSWADPKSATSAKHKKGAKLSPSSEQ